VSEAVRLTRCSRATTTSGDLKPANFLFVNGALKLIDFGIAKAISNDTTNIERDSQIGTVNFMSPEAIQGNTMPNGQRHPEGKMKVRVGKSCGVDANKLVYRH